VRAGEHPRIHPGLPVITLGAGDELTALRAYESGSDHHLPDDTGYLLLRAVLRSVIRRAFEDLTVRQLQVGEIHVDVAARSVHVAGKVVHLSRLEFELLVKFAGDPIRVFSRDDLARCFWRGTSAAGPSTATSPGCAPASPAQAPTTCSSTPGVTAGR
jgi:DNA-binding response OmpR family regulator